METSLDPNSSAVLQQVSMLFTMRLMFFKTPYRPLHDGTISNMLIDVTLPRGFRAFGPCMCACVTGTQGRNTRERLAFQGKDSRLLQLLDLTHAQTHARRVSHHGRMQKGGLDEVNSRHLLQVSCQTAQLHPERLPDPPDWMVPGRDSDLLLDQQQPSAAWRVRW